VSRSLRRLAKAGRVAEVPDLTNSKRNQWRITPDGWALLEKVVPEALAVGEAVFAQIAAENRAGVMDVLAAWKRAETDS
jgi:DNA-binding MarR family transcriptional regulator